jgi:hypothetical protein
MEHPVAVASPIGSAKEAPSASSIDNAPEPEFYQPFARAVRRASMVRGLKPKGTLDMRLVPRQVVMEVAKRDDTPDDPSDLYALEVDTAFEQIPLGFDPTLATDSFVVGQEATGVFDVKNRQLLVAEDAGSDRGTALVHSAIEGLLDQHFDYAARRLAKKQSADEDWAFSIFSQCDAGSAAYFPKGSLPLRVDDFMYLRTCREPLSPTFPRSSCANNMYPYVFGVPFVHRLRARGGWDAVNATWSNVPISTEQVMHPEKYEANERPETVGVAPAPATTGWNQLHSDTTGELGLLITLEEWSDFEEARKAAAGWGGDRVVLYRRGASADFAVAWRIRYDAGPAAKVDAEAREAWPAFERALSAVARGGKITSRRQGQASASCVERSGLGPMAVAIRGREVVWTAGPYHREGTQARSAGHCTAALGWALRAVAAP